MDSVSRLWKLVSRGMSSADLSICKICQTTLLSKIEVLGKTANDAVLNTSSHLSEDGDDNTSDEDTSDDDSASDEETECYENEQPEQQQSVHVLLQRISLWQRPGPRGSTTLGCPFKLELSPIKLLLRFSWISLQHTNILVNCEHKNEHFAR